MPDMFDALGDLPDDEPATAVLVADELADPGMFTEEPDEADEPPAQVPVKAAAKPKVTPGQSRTAVENVLALLGRSGRVTGGAPSTARGIVPSARARSAIETLVQLGSIEALDATRPNLKAMCRDLFDWHSPDGQNRASGNVVKAFGRALTARDEAGVSRYCQAVEMAGFAAAAAPLLQPDRLARVIEQAATTQTAFAPERYTMQLTGALRTILARYPEQRREQLLISLWTAAHDGRWWDMTSGVVQVKVGPPRRRGQAVPDDDQVDVNEMVREVLAGANVGTPQAHAALTDALLAGNLPYNPGTSRLMLDLPANAKLRQGLADLAARMRAGEYVDPDVALMASHLPWLSPTERPESPLTWLAKMLVTAITPDPETGEVLVEALPDKPKQWQALYPMAELVGFPYPAAIRRLDRTTLPGTDGDGRVPALIELISNPAELAANRDYMGNCTWSYKERLERGDNVLFKVWQGADCYNVALWRGAAWGRQQPGPHAWTIGEVNSRFNRGQIPHSIHEGVRQLVSQLPPPEPLPEFARRDPRQVRYGVA